MVVKTTACGPQILFKNFYMPPPEVGTFLLIHLWTLFKFFNCNCVREKWKCFSSIFYWKSPYFWFVHNFIYALSSCLAGNTSSVWYFKRMPFSYCTIVLKLLPTHLEFLCKCPRVYSPICSYSFMFKGLGKQFFEAGLLNTEQVYLEYSKSSLI